MADGHDPVTSPAHYKVRVRVDLSTIEGDTVIVECLDVIDALGMPHHIASMFKYIWRAGRKKLVTALQDWKKGLRYLVRHIEQEERKGASEG